jgi:prepilin-type N-terminal cleavage/methylation domain-containing protein
MTNPQSAIRNPQLRRAFTLMELLVVIMIIALLASLAMMALAGAAESARADRTRSIINKIDQLIREKYESYRTRAVPLRVPPALSTTAQGARYSARVRLYAVRELMRLELPDRISDLCFDTTEFTDAADGTLNTITLANSRNASRIQLWASPVVQIPMPAAARAYKRQAYRNLTSGISSGWTDAHQGAECLYLILSAMKDGDKSALDFFSQSEIGDVDEDGFKEILDGWGTPIAFLRWAPGYTTENGLITLQTSDYSLAPDPFDPLKSDPRFDPTSTSQQKPYALWPLIFSAGKDKVYDINTQNDLVYATTHTTYGTGTNLGTWTVPPNDPYCFTIPNLIGAPIDPANDGFENADNITNHYQAAP